jgi:hypothetical protein
MKRFYHNSTNEPMKYRTWILTVDTVGEDDFKWLKAFEIPIRIEAPRHTFETSNGGTHTIHGKRTITCDTTTDKQRDMLVLKYGNNAVLIQEEVVFPGSISTCTLSGITW